MKLDPELVRTKGSKGDGRRAIVLLVMVLTIAACAVAATKAQPPQQQQTPQPQAQQSTPAALPVDPVLGLTVVQAALLGALVGVLAGGVVTFFVQSKLDKKRRAEVEQRLAYAQLIQVTVFAAGTRTALTRITPYGATAFLHQIKICKRRWTRGKYRKPLLGVPSYLQRWITESFGTCCAR